MAAAAGRRLEPTFSPPQTDTTTPSSAGDAELTRQHLRVHYRRVRRISCSSHVGRDLSDTEASIHEELNQTKIGE